MKALKVVFLVLFILCLPVLLLTASLSLAVNTEWLQHYGFEKYEISEVTGLERAELDKAAAGLIDYFNSGDEKIRLTVEKDGEPFELFNEREVGHLRDVKDLVHLGYWVLLGTFVYALAFAGASLFWWRDRVLLGWGLVGGSGLTLVLMIAIGLVIVFNFDQFFLQFHLISFANDLWMLDPATDYLIMMFPRGFWFDAALFCAIVTAALALILGGTGWWLKQKDRRAEA